MTETAVETYETTTRGAASMAAYRAVRILQLLSENTGEDKAMLSDELIRRRGAASTPPSPHFAMPDTKLNTSAAWGIGS